ncbi:MAG: hypothetical protein KA121_00010, partial [Ferruginibacter sp.]|nr:hypothetical protein [Ferruginibacter sp.]
MMKKFYFAFLTFLLISTVNSFAQVTVGVTPYTTVGAAFAAINAGTHTGAITVNINANTTEPVTAVLNSSGTGAANYTSVLVTPTANVTVTGSIVGAIIKLNGADQVTIDGNNQLTISNTSTSLDAVVVWLASASTSDGATENHILNTTILGSGTTMGSTNTYAGVISSSGTNIRGAADAANKSNEFAYLKIKSCYIGIGLWGVPGNEEANMIDTCTIGSGIVAEKIHYQGIMISNQTDVVVRRNIINGIDGNIASNTNTIAGIEVVGTITNGEIFKNRISDIYNGNLSRYASFGIALENTNGVSGLRVYNNFIWNVRAVGESFIPSFVSDNGHGIGINSGGGYNIWNNSISMAQNQDNGANSSCIFVSSGVGTGLNIRNNILSNTQTTGVRYSMYSSVGNANYATGSGGALNYNDYFSNNFIGFMGGQQATLAAWQAATTQDANSVAVNPQFVGPNSNLHLNSGSPLDNVGSVIAGITTDIDGDTRSATPDIGADEFTSVPCNAAPAGGTASFSAASIITAENICRTGTVDLFATSYGWGGNVTYVWQSGPTAGGPWANIGAPSTVYSDAIGVAISATTFYRLLVNCPGFGSNASTIISATVDNPAIATTTSGTRCGYGTVNLGATAPGYTVNWYTALTGGVPIGTGTSFTTPPINTTTTYYAAATAGSGPAIVGPQLLTPGSTTCGGISVSNLADWPVRFDVMAPITIQSVKVVVVGTSINVGLRASLSNVNIATFNHTYTPAEISAGIATLPLNFVINTAGNYQLTNISGGVGRIPSMSCSYPFNSPGGNFSIVGSAIFSTTSTSTAYYNSFFDFVIVEGCEGTRVAVLATVNTPPAMTLSASPSTTICSGSSVTITATSANPNYTYLWQPGNIAGASISVTPSGTGYYIVTATDITTTPVCVNKDSILITVNPTPANINLAPATASICPNNILNLFVTGGVVPNQTIVHTNVNTGPSLFQADDLIVPTDWISNLISGPAVTQFTRRASPYMGYFNTISNDNSTFFYSDADAGGPGNTTNTEIVSPVMDFTGLGADGAINFWHAYLAWFNDIEVAVQYRVGAGAWNNIQDYTGSSQGTATNFVNANLLLTAVPRVPNVQIRFHYESIWGYYWAIDNIKITGTNTAPITWTYSPGPNPLWATNAGSGGAAYVGGTNATQVWFETGTINTYTVVAHAGSGACTKTDTSIVTVTSAGGVASIGLSSSDGDNKVCAGDSITFSALPSGQMGANANYLWWLDADGPGAGGFVLLVGPNTPPDFTYTYTPATAVSYIKVSMRKKPSDPCTSYPAGDSVFAQVTVYRYSNTSPTISGAVAGCVAPPNINLTANPSSVDITYQWMLNGTPIGGATAQVYGAPGPGNYSVAVINGNACFDTATHVITASNTYTITATATANGMLTPIGAVPVNCNADTSFTAVANVGFTILDVIVDAVSLGPQASPYVYTFLNVNVNHTIHVVFGLAGCDTPASVSMVDTVNICAGNVFSLSDASASVVNAATATWSTAPGWGSGTFSPSTAWGTATTYTPSAADITAGIVKIVLLSNVPPSPCNLASSDTLILRIYGKPSVGTTGIFGYCPSSNTTITANAVFPGAVAYQWYNGVAVTPIGGATMPTHNFNASGTYSVVATGTPGGCKDTSSFTIVAAANPSVTIGGPNLVCEGSTSTSLSSIPVAGSGAITGYQWYTGPTWPATPVVIETNPSYNILVANQTYWVQVTDSYGCTAHNPTGHAVAIDMSPLNGSYTIGPGGQTCSNFASFDSAVSALNRRGISGDVTIQAVSGIVETVPVGGLKLGPVAGNTGTRRIRFTNDGLGAHPLLKAFAGGSATPATVTAQDGIWSISGVDNLTIDGIDLLDENTLNNATMEYGYGFFKVSGTDGCQNDSVINCVITLNKVNNVTGAGTSYEGNKGIWMVNSTSTAPTTALTVTAASGSNSNNRFYNNTISNVHNGIVLYGFAASAGVGPSPSPATFYGDLNNDIGGAVNTNGNTITNYGSNSVAVANIAAAIRVRYQWSNNISFNNINNNNGSGEFHSGVLKGILTADGASANITISNNTIDVKSGSTTAACSAIDNAIGIGAALGQAVNITSNIITGSYTTATSGIWEGIRNQNVNAPTMNINGNRIQNVSNIGTGTWSAIYNIGSSNAVLNINNNVVSNNTINGTGTANFIISTLGTNTNNTISGNTISNNSCASLAITSVISFTSATNTPIVDITTNTIRNNTFTGAFSAARTISMLFYTGAGDVLNISGNQFIDNGITANNNNAVSITLNAVANNVSGSTTYNTETITNNTIDSLYIKGTSTAAQHIRGLNIYNNDAAPVARTYSGNIIKKLAALTGTANTVLGINAGGSNAPFNLFQNTIRRIYSNSAGASTITGVNLPAFTNPISIYNNTIDSVFTTAGTGATITGINNAATGATSMYGNTISNMYFAANTGTSATIHGLLLQVPGDGSAVYENKISNLYFASNAAGATATITGVNIAAGTGYITAYKDSIAKLYTSATVSADIRGININNVSATVSNIYQNKVSELYPGQGAGASTVRGILLGLNSLATVYNNFVNIDLTSAPVPAANAVLTGIRSQAGILANNAGQKLFFNTVRLAGTGSGAAFSSTAVYNNSAAAFEMKNNIFVNLGTAVTPANVMAFTGAVANSNNNNWYATGQTIAQVQTATGGDAASQNINPLFVSTADLHIQNNAANFLLEGTGTAIAGITDDIDGDSRAAASPVDLGADAMMISPWPMYRSYFATGNWDTNTDWEESTDGGVTWSYPAVLKPAKNVNSGIIIQSGHTMNIRLAGESMDHVLVQGTLVLQTGGIMELNNSGGTDMHVDENGKFLVTTTANYATAMSFTSNPDIIVDTLGVIQIGTGAATGTGYEGFATSTDNVWRHDAWFIWNNGLAFSGNATYFPNVATPAYVPVFSVLSTTATTGGTALVI